MTLRIVRMFDNAALLLFLLVALVWCIRNWED